MTLVLIYNADNFLITKNRWIRGCVQTFDTGYCISYISVDQTQTALNTQFWKVFTSLGDLLCYISHYIPKTTNWYPLVELSLPLSILDTEKYTLNLQL